MFSYEFWENLKNNSFQITPPVAASENIPIKIQLSSFFRVLKEGRDK